MDNKIVDISLSLLLLTRDAETGEEDSSPVKCERLKGRETSFIAQETKQKKGFQLNREKKRDRPSLSFSSLFFFFYFFLQSWVFSFSLTRKCPTLSVPSSFRQSISVELQSTLSSWGGFFRYVFCTLLSQDLFSGGQRHHHQVNLGNRFVILNLIAFIFLSAGSNDLSTDISFIEHHLDGSWDQFLLQQQSWLTDLEIFAILIAAIIHDFEHTGTTNNFHVMSG